VGDGGEGGGVGGAGAIQYSRTNAQTTDKLLKCCSS